MVFGAQFDAHEAAWGCELQCVRQEVGEHLADPDRIDPGHRGLERLRRWYRELRTRDLFGAPSHDEAERRLKACTERLEDFAELVYEHGGGT